MSDGVSSKFLGNAKFLKDHRAATRDTPESRMSKIEYTDNKGIVITKRILEDARVVVAYYEHVHEGHPEEEVFKEHKLTKDVLIHPATSIIVRKMWLGQQASETVLEAYRSVREFIRSGGLDDDEIAPECLLYKIQQLMEKGTKSKTPVSKVDEKIDVYRYSDVIVAFDGYCITRQDYVDLYKLFTLKLYLVTHVKPDELNLPFTLTALLNDIKKVKLLKYHHSRSNMIHHAVLTFRRLAGECKGFQRLDVSGMLVKIEKKLGYSPRMDCYDAVMYAKGAYGHHTMDNLELEYLAMCKSARINEEWKQF